MKNAVFYIVLVAIAIAIGVTTLVLVVDDIKKIQKCESKTFIAEDVNGSLREITVARVTVDGDFVVLSTGDILKRSGFVRMSCLKKIEE